MVLVGAAVSGDDGVVSSRDRIVVPAELATVLVTSHGEVGRKWIERLPSLVAYYLDRWQLRLDGPPMHGVVALALPVRRADATPAVLKLQRLDDENTGEAVALRTWDGDGAVRLLAADEDAGTVLVERLEAGRDLGSVPDLTAVRVIGELLVRLNSYQAPPTMRRLADIATRMIADAPNAARRLPDPAQARLLHRWAGAVSDVAAEAGDRLLHWDLHYANVLAGGREPWLAIDPKPLAGQPDFELLPALYNRWEEIVATGDPHRAVRRRFEVLVDVLGLDRGRAVAWTLGRVLQNALWDIEDGATHLDSAQVLIASTIFPRGTCL